jgi:hypothetical protein
MRHPYIEDDYLGNNALPVKQGRCCDLCDCTVVLPARRRRQQHDGTIIGVAVLHDENHTLIMMQTSIIDRVAKIRLKAEADAGIDNGWNLDGPEWITRLMEIEKEMQDTAIPFCFQEVA